MNDVIDRSRAARMRVANFSQTALPLENVLNLDLSDIRKTKDEIRKCADLPYVYLISAEQAGPVLALLDELKSIRSTCYPYALFCIGEPDGVPDGYGLDVIGIDNDNPDTIARKLKEYAASRFVFDSNRLKFENREPVPEKPDVVIVGAGVTGLYAAARLQEKDLSFCVIEKREVIGGIWSAYANTTSQVNTSEGAYRILEKPFRTNRDHSTTREILEDLVQIAGGISDRLHLNTTVSSIEKIDGGYRVAVSKSGETSIATCKGVILAINDRVGEPRMAAWENQAAFRGRIVSGISDEAGDLDWTGKKVVVVGMGAFAVENTRTALEGGARKVTVVCRRHGTVCPKIIDYLNFSTPYNEKFEHDKKSNYKNMILWKKLYDQSGATQPECWMGKIKHTGHTISVSDIWFVGHYLNKIETVTGSITRMTENGVVVDEDRSIEADVVVNCIGFYRNASAVEDLCGYKEMFNHNYVDRDFMYLADAFIDDDVFNSFFGSSVLEMAKFYMDVYLRFFDNPEFDEMMKTEGIEKIRVEDRKWSDYIQGANALVERYPEMYDAARRQVEQRTRNFLESHDLETYIAQNRREWFDTHSLLAGRAMPEDECLPYVFEKLLSR